MPAQATDCLIIVIKDQNFGGVHEWALDFYDLLSKKGLLR
jgi:hypothetical protein